MAASIPETDAFVSSTLAMGQTVPPATVLPKPFSSDFFVPTMPTTSIKQETFMQGLLPAMIGLATVFILLLVFLSIDKVSNHYASASIGDRAKFALFLALFMVTSYNLANLIYRLIAKQGLPNTSVVWIMALLFLLSILSVTFFSWFST